MKIGELFVQLGVKADTFTVRDFGKAIGDIPFAVAGAITSLTGLSIGFLELTKHTLNMSNNLAIFRSETGLSINELQRWEAVARQVGVSGEVVQSSVMGIANAMAQLRLGNGAALLPLGRLGVRPGSSDPFDILNQISKSSLLKSDPNAARQMMSALGISPEMMRILTLGPGKFSSMASGGVVMSSRDVQAMQEFQAALGRFTITIEKSFVPVVVAFEPYMKDLTEALTVIIAGLGGFVFKGIGQDAQIFNMIRKEGFTKFFQDFITGSMTQTALKQGYGLGGAANINLTQNIHSNADAEVVAEIAGHQVTRGMTHAMKQFNNGGY